jgi:hypothetical protein
MPHEPQRRDPGSDPMKDADRDETRREGEEASKVRKANENIRKSQGDDAGQRPVIDRHR